MKCAREGVPVSRHLLHSVLLCFLLCSLAGCTTAGEECISVGTEAYARALEASLAADDCTEFRIEQNHPADFLQNLRAHLATEAYDVQAAPLLEAYGSAYHWYPQYAATVVLAVDRHRTRAEIRGWQDLLRAGEAVGFTLREPDFRLLLSTLSYSLEGDFSIKKAAPYLSLLQRGGLLSPGESAAPVLICFDHEAAALVQQGRHLEIVIPREGTISFTRGLLSRAAVALPANLEEELLRAGFRLPDGRCDESIYPAAADYGRAAQLSDYSPLNKAGQDASRIFHRSVLRTRRFTAADNRESMLSVIFFILVTIAWAGHMVRRIMSKRVRLLVLVITLLLVLWAALRVFKWQMPVGSTVNRYSWYSYYIFLLGLPLALLRLADAAGRPEDAPTPCWWKLCFGLNLALLLMVLTNDLHMQVFQMDLSSSDWGMHYRYGPVYYFLWGVNVLFFLGAQWALLRKGWDSPRRNSLVFPIGFSVLLLAYAILYGLRVQPVWGTDFTIVMGFFSLLFLQTAIFSGLIPVNAKYGQLFAHSPLSMGILDEKGEAVLSSAAPDPPAGAALRFNAIPGGIATWRDDLSAVHALQRGLAKTVKKLERTNAMLRYEHRILWEMETLTAKKKIQVDLDALLDDQLAEISALLEKTGGDEKKNKRILARVGLRLCYIKRRSHLMFWKKQYRTMDSAELMIYLRELGALAKSAGLTCACLSDLQGGLPIDAAIACYSFLFGGLRFAIKKEQKEIICRLGAEDNFISLQLMGESPFEGFSPGEDVPAGSVELRGDGFLFQAVLKIAGGALHD